MVETHVPTAKGHAHFMSGSDAKMFRVPQPRVKMDIARKKKRYSKSKKKNLRKFTDVADIEQYLEERIRDERTGGPVSEKSDESLFFIQKDDDVAQDETDAGPKPTPKLKRGLKPLRSEANLRLDSGIQGFAPRKRKKDKKTKASVSKKVAIKATLESRSDGQTASDDEREVPDSNSAEVMASSSDEEYDYSSSYSRIRQQQSAATAAKKPAKLPQVRPAMRDLWADDETMTKPVASRDMPDEHFLRVTRKMPIKRPNTLKEKPSALPSVEIPRPGASYNPVFEDHQELLRVAVEVEEQKLAAAQRLEKKLKLTPMDHHQREQVWLEEMTEGLFEAEGKGEEGVAEGGSDGEAPPIKRPIRAGDRKSGQRRRKERERREEEKRRAAEKANKIKMADFYRLRSIRREILRSEAATAEKEKQKLEAEQKAIFDTKRLSKYQYQDPDVDVQLSSEIAGSLRRLKPEGSVAVDRFKSLQKRNIIEPRQRVKPYRRYKLKLKEKRSARLPEEMGTLK